MMVPVRVVVMRMLITATAHHQNTVGSLTEYAGPCCGGGGYGPLEDCESHCGGGY